MGTPRHDPAKAAARHGSGTRLAGLDSVGAAPNRLAPGQWVAGRYRVVRELGRGGMGWVLEARDERLQRGVALKVMRPEVASDPIMAARFEREALAASQLSSPHVVVVHDFGRDPDGFLFLVMELMEGESLGHRLMRGPLPVAEALRVATHVARALEIAHAAGIVHRDLKPDNVFLTTSGHAKVLDFGIARILESGDGQGTASQTLTALGSLVGTPLYMSPEAARRGRVEAPADLYSFGAMLFEMLVGEPPFMDDELVLIMGMHIRVPAPLLSEVRPAIPWPPALEALVDQLLAKAAEERGTAEELLARLEWLRADTSRPSGLGASAPRREDSARVEVTPPTRVAPAVAAVAAPRRSPRGVALALVVALAAVLGLLSLTWVAVSLWRGPAPATPAVATPPAPTSPVVVPPRPVTPASEVGLPPPLVVWPSPEAPASEAETPPAAVVEAPEGNAEAPAAAGAEPLDAPAGAVVDTPTEPQVRRRSPRRRRTTRRRSTTETSAPASAEMAPLRRTF